MTGYVLGTTRWWPLTANPTQGFGNPDRAEHLQGVPKKNWELCSELILGGIMASNQSKKKLEIRKYPLKIQFYFNKILISLM